MLITGGLTLTFVLFLAWGLCFLSACIGFGWASIRIIGIRHREAWYLTPGIGLAILVLTGGVLNLMGVVKRPIVIADIIVGVVLLLFGLIYERRSLAGIFGHMKHLWPKGSLARAGFCFIALVLAVRVLAFVQTNPTRFNPGDDNQAYLAFPVKMLAAGSFAADPFSERRILSSLGGITYLQAVALAPYGDLRIINMVDGSIGPLLLTLFAVSLCRRLRLPMRHCLWVLAVLALTPEMRVNTTSIILPAAFLLLVILIYLDPEIGPHHSWRRWLLFGLVAGTACTMKASAIPSEGLFTVLLLVLELWRSGPARALRAAAAIATVVLAVLLPWMIDSKLKCGTFLYPLLGHGYHISSYVHIASAGGFPYWAMFAAPLSIAYALMAIVILKMPRDGRIPVRLIALAGVLTAAVLPLALGKLIGQEISRFCIATFWAVNVLVAAFFFSRWPLLKQATKRSGILFICLALAYAIAPSPDPNARMLGVGLEQARWFRGVQVNLLNKSEKVPESARLAKDRAMQETIPEGAALLVRTDESYGFDFQRNQIWIADYPGSASLPPGMPLDGNPEVLARYLHDHAIRYVAYSYADQAVFPFEVYHERTTPLERARMPMEAYEAVTAHTFQVDMDLLGKTRRHIFDDGKTFVLDLEQNTMQ